ncbi:MAG TPA: F0F1 ATP synthase subunit B [Candidatus Saccharimonadales bacterium]|nr:F0F1 ATP synthase subunit B [Candidatus Saccharimonadales bacterium]
MEILRFFAFEHDRLAEITTNTPQVAEEVTHAASQAVHAAESAGGVAALGLNWQSFLFQLITFVIVFIILRQFVLKKVFATLESRRKTVDDSLKHAAETEKKLKTVETDISVMLGEARTQADDILAASHKEAAHMVEAAEGKAAKRAEHIVAEARAQMANDITQARAALKAETAKLVAAATEKIIAQKLDAQKDAVLIERALKEQL